MHFSLLKQFFSFYNIYSLHIQFKKHDHCSISTAVTTAILKAVKYISNFK